MKYVHGTDFPTYGLHQAVEQAFTLGPSGTPPLPKHTKNDIRHSPSIFNKKCLVTYTLHNIFLSVFP